MAIASQEEAGPLGIELVEMAILPAGGLFLETRRDRAERALEAIVGLWEHVPESSRDLAVSVGRGRWAAAVEAVLRSPADAGEARGAAMLAAGLGEPDMAGSLVAVLELDDERARTAAEIGLLGLSLRARGRGAGGVSPEVDGIDAAALNGPLISGVERAALDVHLADAVWGFAGHQRRLVLLAGLVALDLAGLSAARRDQSGASGAARLVRLVQESSHVAHRAMRQMLRFSPAPLVRERAMLLLAEPAIAEAALERVSRAEGAQEHAAVLGTMSHLGLRPARRRLLRMVRVNAARGVDGPGHGAEVQTPTDIAPGQIVPDRATAAGLDAESRRGAVRLLSLVDADDGARAGALHGALADGDAAVRLAALARLPRAELASYCFDADERVARSAMLRWSSGGLGLRARLEPGERARVAGLLMRSQHASVRRLAGQDAARETVWSAESAASRAGAWRLAIRERDGLLGRMREIIRNARNTPESPGESDQGLVGTGRSEERPVAPGAAIGAIAMARRLGLARVLAADLTELVDPDRGGAAADPRLVATAAAALGDVDDALGRDVLRRLLGHADARVRANAVEAIGAQRLAVEDATTGRDRDYGTLIELKGDASHRVRANAIRALLQSPPACPKERRAARRAGRLIEEKPRVYEPVAVEALGAMLGDARPEHRLAGTWLAGRVLCGGRRRVGDAWSGLGSALADLARRDPSDAVRARAQHAAARLSAGIRASWGGAALDGAGVADLVGGRGAARGDDGIFGLAPVEPAGTAG